MMNANALPVKTETKAGTNWVLKSACESGLPPLIFKKPQVIVINMSVATTILNVLKCLFIKFRIFI